jgi:hypothetical protein
MRRAAVVLPKPVTPICDPPTYVNNWQGRAERPPKRQKEIRRQSEHGEADPEDLPLHQSILSPAFLSRGKRIKRCHDFSQGPIRQGDR